MDDARAVMDAAGSERAVVLGHSEGGPMATLFAATYPERTIGLVAVRDEPVLEQRTGLRVPRASITTSDEEFERSRRGARERLWGTKELAPGVPRGRPSPAGRDDDEATSAWLADYMRNVGEPGRRRSPSA